MKSFYFFSIFYGSYWAKKKKNNIKYKAKEVILITSKKIK